MTIIVSHDRQKHPEENLDYGFDLTDWLTDGELISTISFEADPADLVVLGNEVNTGTKFAVWVSGGSIGDRVKLECTATTDSSPPRTFVRTLNISVVRR